MRKVTGISLLSLLAALSIAFVALALFLIWQGWLVFLGLPHDPGEHGHSPVETVIENNSGFVMRRYRVKAPWLGRFLSGDPYQRSDDGYDTVIVISDISGMILARISHWDGSLKVMVSPGGVTAPGGIRWKP